VCVYTLLFECIDHVFACNDQSIVKSNNGAAPTCAAALVTIGVQTLDAVPLLLAPMQVSPNTHVSAYQNTHASAYQNTHVSAYQNTHVSAYQDNMCLRTKAHTCLHTKTHMCLHTISALVCSHDMTTWLVLHAAQAEHTVNAAMRQAY
jgi:hypothetical protein